MRGSSFGDRKFLCVALALLAASILPFGCGLYGTGSSAFSIRRSHTSVASTTPIVISGKFLAFLADEATTGPSGTDMNGDGDKLDSIAVVIDMLSGVETRLDVATTALSWIDHELYLVVDEALDGRDWNGNGTTNDLVLLHISSSRLAGTPPPITAFDFVDRVSPAGATKMVSFGSNLFYSSARPAANLGESNLFVISSADPTTPTMVPTTDAVGPLSPRILAKDEGLIFLGLDETAEGRDLNRDGDALDTNVLALMDGTAATNAIRSTGLAMPAAGYVLRGRRTSATSHDWSVGFLVSEADQGNTNLNDPALFAGTWKPSQCAGFEDTDTTDCVLHYLAFALWDADPIANPPVNTGLVGCRKIAIANHFIATITPEQGAADPNGAEGSCDLNGDGDLTDYVVRWVEMATPVLPLTAAQNIHALTNVPGGTHGLAELEDSFVVEVSESQDNVDINGDGLKTLDLVGWLTPTGSANADTPWDFTHGGTPGTTYVGASWMSENPDRARMNLALEEKVRGIDLNGDGDNLDSVPTFPRFIDSPRFLSFPGTAAAVASGNAGIVVAGHFGFFRLSEAEDDRDWNGDDLRTGYVLMVTNLAQGASQFIATLNSILGRPAIEFDAEEASPVGAAFITDEQYLGAGGTDLNHDGTTTSLVITYFHF